MPGKWKVSFLLPAVLMGVTGGTPSQVGRAPSPGRADPERGGTGARPGSPSHGTGPVDNRSTVPRLWYQGTYGHTHP